MRPLRGLAGIWRGASFSLKFAAVILVAGATIAVVPLLFALGSTRTQAEASAADKVGIATNLIAGQRESLDAFTAGVARQITAANDLSSPSAALATLTEDAQVIGTSDVIGLVESDGSIVAVQGSTSLTGTDPLVETLRAALSAGASTAATSGEGAWLIATSRLPVAGAIAFVARPMTTTFVTAIDHNIATTSDPVDLLLVRADRRYALAGTVGGHAVASGDVSSATLTAAVAARAPTILSLDGRQVAVASSGIGAGLTLVVITPVTGAPFTWPSVLLLLAVILVAMLFIVVVVEFDLRRPLRRLDSAVAAVGTGDFDVPVSVDSVDEVGRLGASFEAMRLQVRSTMRATAARATVATELSLAQPLEAALSKVCDELRSSIGVETALILVNASDMSDPFAVAGEGRQVAVDGFLDGNGPLGEGYRLSRAGAVMLCATAASAEARLGVREFCVAPLRIGSHVHGVLAVAGRDVMFSSGDTDLVASTAEHISLALERYRFLAAVQRQASVDDLTGLYNHRFLVDSLGQQIALAERLEASLAILMLDIDHFKVLNDTHGHHAGDLALTSFAQTLLGTVRRADLAARYGGEEFVVVMPDTSASEAFIVAEKIRAAVAATDVLLRDQPPVRMTVSIGVAAYPEDTTSAAELISLADQALYRAKRDGRHRTCMASSMQGSLTGHATTRMVQDAQVPHSETNVGAGNSRPQE